MAYQPKYSYPPADEVGYDDEPEILTEYFEDNYDSPSRSHDYDYEASEEAFYGRVMDQHGLSPFSFAEILEHCIEPTIKDAFAHVGKLIFWCMIFRILTQSVSLHKGISVHFISFSIGVLVASHFFYLNTTYMLVFSALAYISLRIVHKCIGTHRGIVLAALCLAFNTTCELLITTPTDWHQVRGAQMILCMKVISLGFDLDSFKVLEIVDDSQSKLSDGADNRKFKSRKHYSRNRTSSKAECSDLKPVPPVTETPLNLSECPTLMEFMGYAFCPGSCVFGPWVKYSDYISIFQNPRWNAAWLMKILFSTIFGFLFLSISTCWNPWLIRDENHRWMLAYRDAMSYRASHYFVSFISDSANVASGFGCAKNTGHWTFQVTEPHNIEVPRSLVEVVVAWNKPMHYWLKTYVFIRTISYGSFIAILATYFASTALHGLNFQLGAVLFSLGFYTYTEHMLRKKLCSLLNAAVGSRRDTSVNYHHKENEFLSIVINLTFGMLAVFHLAYLGVMFDQQEIQSEGYSWRHTIKKWEDLSFSSHWMISFEFLIMCLL